MALPVHRHQPLDSDHGAIPP